MTEKQFARRVASMCKSQHEFIESLCSAGVPDCIFHHFGKVCFIEFKASDGSIRPAQRAFATGCTSPCFVVRAAGTGAAVEDFSGRELARFDILDEAAAFIDRQVGVENEIV